MQTLWRDLRFGFRMLANAKGFTAVAVLTLALGIGANTAMFSVVDAVLLRPLAYPDPNSLVDVWAKFEKQGLPQLAISEPEFWDLIDREQSFSQIAAYSLGGSANLTLAGAQPLQVSTAKATASLFSLLGITPVLGRSFSADDDQPGHSHFALLSYSLWQTQFGGDAEILGKTIRLDGEVYTVLGVLSKQFSLGRQDLWIPLGLNRIKPENRGAHYLRVIARLKPGVTYGQASAALARFAGDLRRAYPANYDQAGENDFGMFLVPLKEQLVGNLRPALLVLSGAVGFVLLIACANVANLLLTHASSREKELAIRAALGAGRSRLTRQLITESLILAVAGGLLGLILAYWGLDAVGMLVPGNFARMSDVRLDPQVLGFTAGVSLLTGLFFGLAPAWHVSRCDLRKSLNESGRGTSAAGQTRFLRDFLVVSELALAVLLLAGAGLLIRSFSLLLNVSPGFRTQNLLTLKVSLPEKAYPDGPPVQHFFTELMARINATSGVQSAGAVSQMPLTDSDNSGSLYLKDTPVSDLPRYQPYGNFPYFEVDQRAATPGYFSVMQIPLVRGRLINDSDTSSSPLVVVVDENLARHFWPQGDAIGQQVAFDAVPGAMPTVPRWRTIVGIVGHVKHDALDVEGREQVYSPHAQPLYDAFSPRDMTLAVSSSLDSASLTNAIREQVLALDKDLALYDVNTMQKLVSNSVAQRRLSLSILGAFAALALLLAAVGVYGVMAFAVAQRTREIGIRLALGATPGEVLRRTLAEGGRLIIYGLLLGIGSALVMTQLMTSLLFGVKSSDPLTLCVAAALLSLVALAACYIPARRVTRVDLTVALRYE